MPIYEYRCQQGHTFEEMQRISDDPIEVCDTCGSPAQRVFHPVAIHFKGSGFYNTDYGTRKRQRENGEKKDSGSESGSSDSKSSDSKSSDSKSDSKSSDSKPASKAAAA